MEYTTARHYGAPLVEQTRVDEGQVGLADGWDRAAILVTGEEARSWLNGFISQKIDAAAPGTATDGLLLDAQGRVQQEFGISVVTMPDTVPDTVPDTDTLIETAGPAVLLDVAADRADDLEDFLRTMVFWAKVEITRPDIARLSLLGSLPDNLPSDLPSNLPRNLPDTADGTFPGPGHAGTTTALSPRARFWRTRVTATVPVTDLWVPRAEVTDTWDDLVAAGAHPTGGAALDAWRLRDRRPVLGVDADERLIPHEVRSWIGDESTAPTRLADDGDGPTGSWVHLNKGCYRGQETVSRVHNLGRPPRLLVLLQLDGSAGRLPTPGAPVTADGRTVGRVGHAVQDADYGPVALALVKRPVIEATAAGTAPPLQADGIDAAVDRDDLHVDTSVRPGRAAVDKLKGRG